jgi:membrane protease YdiL (CAAX protease family)
VTTYPWPRIIGVTAAAAIAGLITLGQDFPSFGSFATSMVWKLAMGAILLWGWRRWEACDPDAASLGFRAGRLDRSRTRPALLGLAGCAVLAVIIGQLFPSATSGEAYGTVQKAGLALTLAELLIRYPTTVLVEEAFFRGWLQPRIPRWAPVASGVLFAAFHLQQVSTIPSLIPLGIALGIIRWWTDNVRATSVIHYASNATFFVTTYV